MFGVSTRINQLRLDATARLDARRLQAAHPYLVPDEKEWTALRQTLLPAYKDYVVNVSSAEMAASLETSVYLYHVCRATMAENVLDLGSGFSSYVLRLYAREVGHPVEVTSVDDDADWLDKTQAFLQRHDLGADRLIQWSSYKARPMGSHNLVFHDLAGGDTREEAMPLAAATVAEGGVIVFDDAQHAGHRKRMYREGRNAGLQLYSLKQRTLDSIGRWAILGVAPR